MDELKQRLIQECLNGDPSAARELYRLCGRQEDWNTAKLAISVLIPTISATQLTSSSVQSLYYDEVTSHTSSHLVNLLKSPMTSDFTQALRTFLLENRIPSDSQQKTVIFDKKVKSLKKRVFLTGHNFNSRTSYDYHYQFQVCSDDTKFESFSMNLDIAFKQKGTSLQVLSRHLFVDSPNFVEIMEGPSYISPIPGWERYFSEIEVEIVCDKTCSSRMRLEFSQIEV